MNKIAIGYDFKNKEAWVNPRNDNVDDTTIAQEAVKKYGKSAMLYSLEVEEDYLDDFSNTINYLVMAVGIVYGFHNFLKFKKGLEKELKKWSKNGHRLLDVSYEEAINKLLK